MRVLLDGRPLRDGSSGVGQYVRHLLLGLASFTDVDLEVLTFDFLGRSNALVGSLGLDSLNVREHRRVLLHRKAFNGMAAYLPFVPLELFGLAGFDVVHTTYFERFARPSRRTATVSTIHDVAFLRMPDMFPHINLAASQRALREQLDRSDLTFCVSQFTKHELVSLAGADPARVIVTPLAATDAIVAVEGRPAPRPYVLYVGNIEPRKNLPNLVRAWRASRLGDDFDLVIAGAPLHLAGPSMVAIEGAADAHVRYAGYVTAEEKAWLLQNAACFVYPSYYEGFGIPLLEAMYRGVPVVASDSSAVEEVSGDAAYLVDPSDVDSIADGLVQVLSDQALAERLIAAGRIRAGEFTWTKTAAATREGYVQAVRIRADGPRPAVRAAK